jgi:drug/metabolite transporter (DMT)-like permease
MLAFHWMNKYQAHVSPAHAALLYTLEPIFATLWATLLPDLISPLVGLAYRSERPGVELVVGGGLILVGNAVALGKALANEAA